MGKRLRQALARGWAWFGSQGYRGSGVLSRIAAKKERREESSRSEEARARFWTELREGQREAEAQSSRSRS